MKLEMLPYKAILDQQANKYIELNSSRKVEMNTENISINSEK